MQYIVILYNICTVGEEGEEGESEWEDVEEEEVIGGEVEEEMSMEQDSQQPVMCACLCAEACTISCIFYSGALGTVCICTYIVHMYSTECMAYCMCSELTVPCSNFVLVYM